MNTSLFLTRRLCELKGQNLPQPQWQKIGRPPVLLHFVSIVVPLLTLHTAPRCCRAPGFYFEPFRTN